MSIHIQAKQGEIADCILLPGDPLRAKHIAETFLDGAVQYNSIRNIFGYTGEYKGKKVSVQGTGMGMPSFSIYANELMNEYGVRKLLRVGTCGALCADIHIRDVILAQGACTDSSMLHNTFGPGINYAPIADFNLLTSAYSLALKNNIKVKVGNIISEDRFYNDELDRSKLVDYGIMAVEMEAAALYLLAAKYHAQSLAILTVSDHHITHEAATAEERQTSFNDMIKLALDTAIL